MVYSEKNIDFFATKAMMRMPQISSMHIGPLLGQRKVENVLKNYATSTGFPHFNLLFSIGLSLPPPPPQRKNNWLHH